MALDGTNFEEIKPFSALEQMVRGNLSEYNVEQGNDVSPVNIDEVRAIAAYIDKAMTLFEGDKNLSPKEIYDLREPAIKLQNDQILQTLNAGGAKTVAARLVRHDNNPDSLSPLMRAKYDAALDVVNGGENSDYKQNVAQNLQAIYDKHESLLLKVARDQTLTRNEININDYSAKKLAEAMDKIAPDVLETLQSDPETYNQAIADIHHITMMHGKPYGFSSKAKAIAAKISDHVQSIEKNELDNYVQELYMEDQVRLDALKERLDQASQAFPDLANGIKTDKESLFEIQTLIDGSDWKQFEKMKSQGGKRYLEGLLTIATISQDDQTNSQDRVNAVISQYAKPSKTKQAENIMVNGAQRIWSGVRNALASTFNVIAYGGVSAAVLAAVLSTTGDLDKIVDDIQDGIDNIVLDSGPDQQSPNVTTAGVFNIAGNLYTTTSTLATASPTSVDIEPTTYVVQSGDNLTRIAEHYGVTVDSIMDANESITDRDKISTGQEITISFAPDEKTMLPRVRQKGLNA